jgi:hypothetical protein
MTWLRGVVIGFTLGTLILAWAVLWWLLIRTVHRWLWRLQDRAEARIRGRKP